MRSVAGQLRSAMLARETLRWCGFDACPFAVCPPVDPGVEWSVDRRVERPVEGAVAKLITEPPGVWVIETGARVIERGDPAIDSPP